MYAMKIFFFSNTFFRFSFSLVFFCLLILLTNSANAQQYDRPTINRIRIDYCYTFSQGCGKKAADAFCMGMGASRASQFQLEEKVGYTVNIGDRGSICQQPNCGGFLFIMCE
jgi:hypothetical protein